MRFFIIIVLNVTLNFAKQWSKSEEKPENWGRWGFVNEILLAQEKVWPLRKYLVGSAGVSDH